MDALNLVILEDTKVKVEVVAILKETPKQYQVSKNSSYHYRVNKEMINKLDSNSLHTYMFCTDVQLAYQALLSRCRHQIKSNQKYAKTLEATLSNVESMISNE